MHQFNESNKCQNPLCTVFKYKLIVNAKKSNLQSEEVIIQSYRARSVLVLNYVTQYKCMCINVLGHNLKAT